MYKKLILAGVLVAFLCVQLATSLTCYTCTTAADCKKPSKVTCSNAAANETSYHLAVYHQNVANATSSRFDCLALRYTQNNNTIHQLHGCVHPAVNACGLALKPNFSSWTRSKCVICSGNKCNKNPAGKMSNSFYTILAAIVGLILVKTFT